MDTNRDSAHQTQNEDTAMIRFTVQGWNATKLDTLAKPNKWQTGLFQPLT